MNNELAASLLAFIFIPIVLSMMFIPYWTRRTESFGVSIPESYYLREDLRNMRKHYVVYTGILSVLSLVMIFLMGGLLNERTLSLGFGVITVVYIIASFFIYLYFHRRMKALKAKEKWSKTKTQQLVVDTSFRNYRLTYSNLWFLIPLLITLVTILFTFQMYDKIPDRFPMQYNFSGEVTNWADKSYKTLLLMPVMQIYLTVIFLFTNIVISRAKQQVSAEQPERSLKQNLVFRRRWSAFTIWSGIGMVLLFSFSQYTFIYPVHGVWVMVVPLVFTFAIVAGAIVLSVSTGQGGSRVKTVSGSDGGVIDRDDDRHWKLGQIYFNPKDPALFLEKRFGVGWTVNFARPSAWVVLVVIIGLAVVLPFLFGA